MTAPEGWYYSSCMRTHRDIEQRSRAMMAAIVDKIEADPDKKGLQKARSVCRRWMEMHDNPYIEEWCDILEGRWEDIKRILLEDSEEADSLRQCNPFCGILTPKERWAIYREFGEA